MKKFGKFFLYAFAIAAGIVVVGFMVDPDSSQQILDAVIQRTHNAAGHLEILPDQLPE